MIRNRTLERRVHIGDIEIRSQGNSAVIEGHAAVFDKRSQNLGGFVEVVRRSAFTKTLQEADVRALQNHDENLVLGRNKSGTLDLSTDDSGLYYRISPPDTSYARDLQVLLERGDVSQSSFAFHAIDDDWDMAEDDVPLRSLNEVRLVDVSVVTYPAYLDSDSGIARKAALASLAKRSHMDVDELDPETIRKIVKGENDTPPEGRKSTLTKEEVSKWDRYYADLDAAIRRGDR